ncbi:MAG: nucleoside monophosphate kinase [Candidatus Paceibacterota bacterium]|jgi:adenylate kinase
MNSEPQAFIFIGKSGCGKGTQVELFKSELEKKDSKKIIYFESGSFLRELAKSSSYTAERTKEVLDVGGLMPEAIIVGLWMDHLMNNFTGKENLVFDGAPRKLAEAVLLDGTLEFYKIPKYKVIYINVGNDWAKARLLGRARKDDTEDAIKSRLAWFDKEVMPSIEFFKNNKNCTFIDINGEQTIEEVHKELMKKIGW